MNNISNEEENRSRVCPSCFEINVFKNLRSFASSFGGGDVKLLKIILKVWGLNSVGLDWGCHGGLTDEFPEFLDHDFLALL